MKLLFQDIYQITKNVVKISCFFKHFFFHSFSFVNCLYCFFVNCLWCLFYIFFITLCHLSPLLFWLCCESVFSDCLFLICVLVFKKLRTISSAKYEKVSSIKRQFCQRTALMKLLTILLQYFQPLLDCRVRVIK